MYIIRQQNGTHEFKVFRKNTHTDRYLIFNSYHPAKYKEALIDLSFVEQIKFVMTGFCRKKINTFLKHSEEIITYPACVIRREEIQSRQVSNNSNPEQKYYGAPYI